jgi:hypothetical protein
MDTALISCKWNEMRNPAGAVVLKLEADHFELERHAKGQLPQDSFYYLDGLQIYILPSALERLRGKRLVTKVYHFGKRSLLTLFFRPSQIELLKAEPVT